MAEPEPLFFLGKTTEGVMFLGHRFVGRVTGGENVYKTKDFRDQYLA